VAIQLGEAFIDITAKDNKLVQSLSKAEQKTAKSAAVMSAKLAGIGKGMTIAGGVITAAFGAIVTKTTQLGDKLDKMSKRTNISVEQLSALGYAAKISGADLDTVEKSLRYLARGMNDASQGVGEAKEAFEELNISVTDTEGNLRPTMDVLKEAATKLAAMTDETKQVALATDIFGARYGTQLLPMLKEGGDGIEALMEKAKELGIVMSTEAAAKAAEFNDRITDLKESVGGMGRSIGEILIPPLIKFSEKALEIIKKIKAWADAHKPLVEMIVKVAATLGVLAAVGGPILLAVSVFLKMKVAITAVSVAMKALAISSGPIGWLILAVGALYMAWETNFGGIRDFTTKVVDEVKGTLKSLRDSLDTTREAFTNFSEGLESGGGGGVGAFADDIDTLKDSMGGLETNTDNAKEALNEFGEKIETFDEWVKRLEEETTKANNKIADEAEKAMIRYEEAMQPVEDRLYELSHTEEEVAARNLLKKKEYLEAVTKTAGLTTEHEKEELTKIKEWYDKEIGLIVTKLEEQQDALIETAKTTETSANTQIAAIREIKKEWGGLIDKIEEAGTAAAKVASQAAIEAFLAATPTIEETGYTPDYTPKDTPQYASGTPYVPKTELAIVHKGEAVIPANQNNNNNAKSYTININNPVVRDDNDISRIRQQVEQALTESSRQFNRSGNVLIPGMA